MVWFFVITAICLLLICFRNQGVPVMLFHQVNENSNVKPNELESYFSYLSKKKYQTYTLKEIDVLFKTKKKLSQKSVVLTFDDGYYDNYKIVFPLLKKHNLKAVFFVNTLFIGDKYDRSDVVYEQADLVNARLIDNYFKAQATTSAQYFSWEEICEMELSGHVDIQCHSHRHGMVFSNTQFKNVIHSSFASAGDYFVLNGSIKPGFPLFKMRGELTQAGLKIDESGKELFKTFFDELENLSISKKHKTKMLKDFFTTDFIQKHIYSFNQSEFKERVEKEILDNKTEIETHLPDKRAIGFAWPYGHQSKLSIPWMQSLGIEYFFTCKKGTNARSFDPDFIYRIELRRVTASRLKLLTKINSNFALGWLYRWVS